MDVQFTSVIEFCKLTGIKETFLRTRILHHELFKEFVFKPTSKYLIQTKEAQNVLPQILRELEN